MPTHTKEDQERNKRAAAKAKSTVSKKAKSALDAVKSRVSPTTEQPGTTSAPKVDTARAEAEQRFKESGGTTSKPVAPTVKKPPVSGLRRLGLLGAAATAAAPVGRAIGETIARQTTGVDVDPATGESVPAGNVLQSLGKSLNERFSGAIQADVDAQQPPTTGLRSLPVTTPPVQTQGGMQRADLGGGSFIEAPSDFAARAPQQRQAFLEQVQPFTPTAPVTTTEPTPQKAPFVRATPTFSERKELENARRAAKGLRDKTAIAQANERIAQAERAIERRIGTETKAAEREVALAQTFASEQAAQKIAAAKQQGAGALSFRDQLALYKQQYKENQDAIAGLKQDEKEVFSFIDTQFADDPAGGIIAKAMLRQAQTPGDYDFKDQYGVAARSVLKDTLVSGTNEERGLYDYITSLFGEQGPVGEGERAGLDFEGWSVGEGEKVIGDNRAFIAPDGENYLYLDDISNDQTRWLIEQLIQADNQTSGRQRQGLR